MQLIYEFHKGLHRAIIIEKDENGVKSVFDIMECDDFATLEFQVEDESFVTTVGTHDFERAVTQDGGTILEQARALWKDKEEGGPISKAVERAWTERQIEVIEREIEELSARAASLKDQLADM